MHSIAYGIVEDIFFARVSLLVTRVSLLEFNCVFLKYMFHCQSIRHMEFFSASLARRETCAVCWMIPIRDHRSGISAELLLKRAIATRRTTGRCSADNSRRGPSALPSHGVFRVRPRGRPAQGSAASACVQAQGRSVCCHREAPGGLYHGCRDLRADARAREGRLGKVRTPLQCRKALKHHYDTIAWLSPFPIVLPYISSSRIGKYLKA